MGGILERLSPISRPGQVVEDKEEDNVELLFEGGGEPRGKMKVRFEKEHAAVVEFFQQVLETTLLIC